jgi:2,4'-dihydroxyacetophenone dioxygenase
MDAKTPIPVSFHRAEKDLPFVEFAEGITFQLLQVNIEGGYWVVRVRFEPGVTIQKHKHTGEVFAHTIAGSWKYLEYPEVNRPGSFLYEPAGAIHTLHVLESNTGVTDVFFVVHGANLDLDEQGNVENVLDAGAVLQLYLEQCKKDGHPRPKVIGL